MPHTLNNKMKLRFYGVKDSFSIAQCYERGSFVEKDLSVAMQFYLEAAESGNADAYYRLGNLLEQNENIDQALVAFSKAALQGNEEAKSSLKHLADAHVVNAARYFAAVLEKEKRFDNAKNYYLQEITDSNDPLIMFHLAQLIEMQNDFEDLSESETEADSLIEDEFGPENNPKMEENSDTEVDVGTDNDFDEALFWYYKSARAGCRQAVDVLVQYAEEEIYYSRAYFYLGQLFDPEFESELVKDMDRALEFYRKGRKNADIECIFRLGLIFEKGICGVEIDPKLACNYFIMLLDFGKEVESHLEILIPQLSNEMKLTYCITVAEHFMEKNELGKAADWYRKVWDFEELIEIFFNETPEVAFRLATAFHTGDGVRVDPYIACRFDVFAMNANYEPSKKRMLEMEKEGHVIAQYVLALKYYMPKYNKVKAFGLFIKAAESGYSSAQQYLKKTKFTAEEYVFIAKIYEEKDDQTKAIDNYRHAFKLGSPIAAFWLGSFYRNLENYEFACDYYVEAARGQHELALTELERLAETGNYSAKYALSLVNYGNPEKKTGIHSSIYKTEC